MAQKLRDDKIGTLQHNAGNIQMLASVSNPAYLTIGGQQYKITTNLTRPLPSLTANTRYQVFAVNNAGTIELRITTNENSVGPAGFSRWKLIGSLSSDGAAAFSSFNNIKYPATNIQATVNKSENTNYQAEVDGFFVGRILGTNDVSAVARWDVFTDSSPTPSTIRQSCYSTGHSAAQFWSGAATGFCVPIKKGDYYRVTRTDDVGTQGYSAGYFWIPSASTNSIAIEDL